MVPLVMTPKLVYIVELGFFFTPRIGRKKEAFSSGWVTFAFLNLKPIGLINLSNLAGFRVNPSPTNVAFVTMRFHAFLFGLPDLTTLKTSASDTPLTFGIGTFHLPAFSFLFCLIVFDKTFARIWFSRSNR